MKGRDNLGNQFVFARKKINLSFEQARVKFLHLRQLADGLGNNCQFHYSGKTL